MIQMTYKLPHLLAARSRSKCDIPNFNKSFNYLTPTQSIFHIINKGVARNILWGLFLSIGLIYGDYGYSDDTTQGSLVSGTDYPDFLEGTTTNDVFEGLAGNDRIDGHEGIDTVSYEHAPKKVNVNLAKNLATGGAGKDKLANIENVIGSVFADTLTGNGADNLLSGLAGNDKLNGGTGRDTLIGGIGHDVLTGGKGADTFRFDNLSSADRITDFSKAQGDLIHLDASVFTHQNLETVKKLALAKNGQRLIYEKSSGRLFYDTDGAGTGSAAQLIVTVTNKPALDNTSLLPCGSVCDSETGNTDGNEPNPDGGTPLPPAFITYKNATLPGRLLVNSLIHPAEVFNLQDGSRIELPPLPKTIHDDTVDSWDINPSKTLLTRLSNANWRKNPIVGYFDVNTYAKQSELLLPDNYIGYTAVRLSADGKYLLTFHNYQGRYDTDRLLTVFDAASGVIVEEGSKLDGEVVTGFPAAWAPNGDYVYMFANELYVTSPLSPTVRRIATFNLPPTNSDGRIYSANVGSMVVSPDGTKLAFTWNEFRKYDQDTHVYVVNMDGTGLHRLTEVPDKTSPLSFQFVYPTWSPDSQWVALVLEMSGVTTAPVFILEDISPWKVTGTTGCGVSPVLILPATAENVTVSWPKLDPNFAVKVKSSDGNNALLLTTCNSIRWLP